MGTSMDEWPLNRLKGTLTQPAIVSLNTTVHTKSTKGNVSICQEKYSTRSIKGPLSTMEKLDWIKNGF